MSNNTAEPALFDVDVTTRGRLPGAAEYARTKIAELARFTDRPAQHVRVKLTRHPDPAVERPVVAQGNIDVGRRVIRAQVEGTTAREAIDRLQTTLRRRLERTAEHWQARRGKRPAAEKNQWRHQSEPTQRPSHFPRPVEERRVVRRKSFAPAACTAEEAALEMEMLDYEFHLFIEKGTGMAGVLYRDDPTGYRLALVIPAAPEELAAHDLRLTVSPHPAPCITVEQAAERLGLLGLPFLFFVDVAQGRANVLYHRYDGHYGLITLAAA